MDAHSERPTLEVPFLPRDAAPIGTALIVAALALAVGRAFAFPCDTGPTIPVYEFVVNGEFDESFSGWTLFPQPTDPPAPGQPAFTIDAIAGDPAAKVVVDPASACTALWCAKLRQWDGPLIDLRQGTVYTLRFRARAAAGTPTIVPEIYLRERANPDGGYFGAVWSRTLTLDQTFREYVFELRTPDTLPDLRCDPQQRMMRFDINMGGAGTTIWIDSISLRASEPLVLGSEALRLASFEAGEHWEGAGTAGASFGTDTLHATHGSASMKITVPPDGGAFVARTVPIDLGDRRGPGGGLTVERLWDMTLSVCTDHPERIGRMYVIARTQGVLYSWRSFGGFRDPCQTVVLRKEEFFKQIFNTGAAWGNVTTLGIKVDSNSGGADAPIPGSGDVNVWIDDIVVHPKAAIDGSEVEAIRPPLLTSLRVRSVTHDSVVVAWDTDEPAVSVLRCGLSPGTGTSILTLAPALHHEVALGGLQQSATYHCQATSTDGEGYGNASVSGDFTVDTEPPPGQEWAAASVDAYFPIGLGSVPQPADQILAKDVGFNTVHTYVMGACREDYDAMAGAYLSAAIQNQLRALITLVCGATIADRNNAPYQDQVNQRIDVLLGVVAGSTDPDAERALLGYYLADEPELNLIRWDPPDCQVGCHEAEDLAYFIPRLRGYYDTIKLRDPIRPVFDGVTFVAGNPFFESWDVPSYDNYPVPYRPISSMAGPLEATRGTGEPFHFIAQAYSFETDRNWPLETGASRYPSYDETRAMAYMGLVHGAKGIWFHAQSEITPHPGTEWHYNNLGRVARELRRLEPVLASPAAGPCLQPDAASTIKAITKVHAGHAYVLTVEASGAARTEGFHLGAGVTGDVTVLGENRSLPLVGGGWTDDWKPYGVHVYRIVLDPSGAPAPPVNLTASRQGTNDVALSWQDRSCDEFGFTIERRGGPDAGFRQIAATAEGVTSATDHPPLDFALYTYRVGAFADLAAAYGNEATVAVLSPAPSSLAVVGTTPSSLTLTWADPSNNEEGFRIERGTSSSGPFVPVQSLASPPFTDTTYPDAATSFYSVTAYRSGIGESGPSNVVSVAMPLRPPSGLVATPSGATTVQLVWSDRSTSESGYKIERALSANGTFSVVSQTGPSPAMPIATTVTTPGATYYYRVYAFKTGFANSVVSNTAQVTTLALQASAPSPTNSKTGVSKSGVTLKWTAGQGAVGHTVFFGTNAAALAPKCTGITTRQCATGSLSPLTTYYWRVDEVNSAGASTTGVVWRFTTRQ